MDPGQIAAAGWRWSLLLCRVAPCSKLWPLPPQLLLPESDEPVPLLNRDGLDRRLSPEVFVKRLTLGFCPVLRKDSPTLSALLVPPAHKVSSSSTLDRLRANGIANVVTRTLLHANGCMRTVACTRGIGLLTH